MRRSLIFLLIALIVLMALGALSAYVYFSVKGGSLEERARVALVAELGERVNGKVEVGRVRLRFPNMLVVEGFRIKMSPNPGGLTPGRGEILDVREVIMNYDLLDIILRKARPIQSISGVRFIEPRLYLERDAAGRWNFEDLVREVESGEQAIRDFRARVVVKNGEVEVVTHADPELHEILKNVDGKILFKVNPTIQMRLSAVSAKAGGGSVSLQGWFDYMTKKFTVDGAWEDVSPRYLVERGLALWNPAKIEGGNADIDLQAEGVIGGGVSYKGGAELSGGRITYETEAPSEKPVSPETLGLGTLHKVWADGDFNVQFKGVWGDKPSYEGNARLADGGLTFSGFPLPFQKISGTLSFDGKEIDIRKLKGNLGGAGVSLAGKVYPGLGSREPEFDIKILSSNLDLGPLNKTLISVGVLPKGAGVGGIASLALDVKGTFRNPVYEGGLAIRGGSLKFPQLRTPLSGIEARVSVANGSLKVESMHGTVGGSDISVVGSVFDLSKPRFDLRIFSSRVDVGEMTGLVTSFGLLRGGEKAGAREIKIEGKGSMDLMVKGDFRKPFLEGTIELDSGTVSDENVQDARVAFRYGNDSLRIADFGCSVYGGRVSGSGLILQDKSGTDASFEVRVDNLDLSLVKPGLLATLPKLQGRVFGNAVVKVSGGDVEATGTLFAKEGSIEGYEFDTFNSKFRLAGDKLWLDGFKLGAGSVEVGGRGSLGVAGGLPFDLDLVMQGVELKDIFKRVKGWTLPVEGKANFAGNLTGNLNDLALSGFIDAKNGTIGKQAYDHLSGKIQWSREEFLLDGVSASKGASMWTTRGRFLFGKKQGLDFVVTIDKAQMSEVLALAGVDADIEGSVSGTFVARGPLENVPIDGSLVMTRGKVFGQPIDRATADFHIEGNDLAFSRLEGAAGSSTYKVSGKVSEKGILALRVVARGVHLEEIIGGESHPIKGIADFDGEITGTLKSPEAKGTIGVRQLELGRYPFTGGGGQAEFSRGTIKLSRFKVMDGQGSITLTGKVGVTPRLTLDMVLDLEDAMFDKVLAVVNPRLARDAGGKVSGTMEARGPWDNPAVKVSLGVKAGKIGGMTVDELALNAEGTREDITLRKFRITQGKGFISASGRYTKKEDLSLEAIVKDFGIQAFAPFFNVRYDMEGLANLTVKASGKANSPRVTCSLEVRNGAVGKLYFDRLSGFAVLENGVINIQQAVLTQGQHKASLYGRVPLSARYSDLFGLVRPKGDRIDLTVKMSEVNMALLGLLSEEIEHSEGNGNVNLSVVGTSEHLQVNGEVSIINGKIKYSGLSDPITGLEGKILFAGDEVRVESMTGSVQGSDFTISGKARIAGFRLSNFDFQFRADKLRIANKDFSGFVDCELTLKGSFPLPTLGGQVKLTKADITLTAWNPPKMPPLDAKLSVEVLVGNDVRLRNKLIDTNVSGKLKLAGTLRHPAASGTMEARRGNFTYLGTDFRLTSGSAEFEEYRGIIPVLDLRAETTVGNARIFLALKGPINSLATDLSSSPPMGQHEILALLDYPGAINKLIQGDVETLLREQIVNLLDQELRLRLVGDIERIFREASLLDEFRIERDSPEKFSLRLGKYVVDNLYLGYTTTLGNDAKGTLRFEYRYSPAVVFSGRFEDTGKYTLGIEARFRF